MIISPKPPEQLSPTLADLAMKTKMDERNKTDKFKPYENQTKTITDESESKMSQESTIPELQTLSM